MGPPHSKRATFKVNVLAPFLLTVSLLPALLASSRINGTASRVVNVASSAHLRSQLSDVAESIGELSEAETYPLDEPDAGLTYYSRSKLALLLYSHEMRRRIQRIPQTPSPSPSPAVSVVDAHPGLVLTDLLYTNLPLLKVPLLRRALTPLNLSPRKGASTVLEAALSSSDSTGTSIVEMNG